MLVVWTADKKEALAKVVGPQIAASGLQHKIAAVEDALPETGAGDVVLCMGTKALEVLVKHGLAPKSRTVSSLRPPHSFPMPNGAVGVMTYAAGMVYREYDKYVGTLLDLALAIRRVRTGSFAPVLGKYRYVNDFSDAIKWIENRYEATKVPVEVSFDTETVGLDPLHEQARFVTVQFTYKAETADVVYFPTPEAEKAALSESSEFRKQVQWLLNTEKVSLRCANGKYDMGWMWARAKIECTNFKFDTTIVGSLLDEDRGNSLNLHAKWYLPDLGGYDDEFNAKYKKEKNRMDLVAVKDPQGFLNYAGGDTDACLRVSQKMKVELLRDEGLARFYINLLHPAARAYEHVERTGLLVDVPYYLELELEIQKEIARLEKEALKLLGGRIIAKFADNLKLSRDVIIKEFMFGKLGLGLKPQMLTEKTKEPSTSIDHLLMFADVPEAKAFVAVLEEWHSARKTLSTYVVKRDADGIPVKGFLVHLRSDGRFHPSYFMYNGDEDDGGTNTGRLSARDPAIQTVPKHTKWAKKLRRAFIAPPGFLILGNDYSQGELKIAACLANEQRMLETYSKGIDLHAVTAASLSGMSLDEFLALKKTDEEKYGAIRQLAKAGNFGLIYGMGANGFQIYAKFNYGVNLTEQEATEKRDKFFATYPGLLDWHKKYKQLAHNWGHVRSPLGRVRHLPMIYSKDSDVRSKAERQSVNAPVQSCLSDMSLWATSLFWKKGWHVHSPVITMIHDQLVSYVPEDSWEKWASQKKQVMENLPFHELGWQPQLKFTVDCEVGPNLAELKKQEQITY